MTQLPRYNAKLSPTAAATTFFKDLEEAGLPVINLGQGRETAEAPEDIFPGHIPAIAKRDITSLYNPRPAGTPATRSVAADYITRFLGIPATAETTFVLQQNGRTGLYLGLLQAIGGMEKPAVVMPELRWPMYDDHWASLRLQPLYYSNPTTAYDSNIGDVISRHENAVAVVTNSPHNPTGKHYPRAFFDGLTAEMDAANEKRAQKIIHILDIPYFYALPETSHSVPYLDTGFEKAVAADAKTPWIAVISFSKALGTAAPGLTFVVTHPALATTYQRLVTQTIGVAYLPTLYTLVETGFVPEKDAIHRAHFARLRAKYEANWKTLKDAFGTRVIDGDAGMTALIHIGTELLNCTLDGPDGTRYVINNTASFLEYLGHVHHVVAVDQGPGLVRVAHAQNPDTYAAAIEEIVRAVAALEAQNSTQALRAAIS